MKPTANLAKNQKNPGGDGSRYKTTIMIALALALRQYTFLSAGSANIDLATAQLTKALVVKAAKVAQATAITQNWGKKRRFITMFTLAIKVLGYMPQLKRHIKKITFESADEDGRCQPRNDQCSFLTVFISKNNIRDFSSEKSDTYGRGQAKVDKPSAQSMQANKCRFTLR
jgi:hypothetical protein